jgi:hypothetical protein
MTNLQTNHADVAELLRQLAESPETIWSFGSHVRADGGTHALDEMRKDDIDHSDLVYVMSRCAVVRSEPSRFGEIRYRAVGRNVDGVKMTFIVTIWEKMKKIEVVTAWSN